MHSSYARAAGRAAGTVLVAAVLAAGAMAQTNGEQARFSAVAVDLDRGTATPIQIAVDRWSTDAERDKLMDVMADKGADALLEALQDTEPVGYIRTNTSLAWDLHFARRMPGKDGGHQIILATDRPLSFGEMWSGARTTQYPFTIIELHVPPSGEGDGTLSIATKVIPDLENNIVVLENYDTQRIRLTQVRREDAN